MVNVLVATSETQGSDAHDRVDAVEGELVVVPPAGLSPNHAEHCGPAPIDGEDCRCGWAFLGMASNAVTTTALVVDRGDLRDEDLWYALRDAMERQGLLTAETRTDPESETEQLFRLAFQRTVAAASYFAAGSVLERRGDLVRCRAMTEPLRVPHDVLGGES